MSQEVSPLPKLYRGNTMDCIHPRKTRATPISFTTPPLTPTQKQPNSSRRWCVPSVYATFPPPLTTRNSVGSLSSCTTRLQNLSGQGSGFVPRVNPLRPAFPDRMTMHLETEDATYHNDQRRRAMIQREHLRFYSSWSKFYYGEGADREIYRRYLREGLKEQMSDRQEHRRQLTFEKAQNALAVLERDKTDVEKDLTSARERHQYLSKFRDANKQMMDESKQQSKMNRFREQQIDLETLKSDPINWSRSLK